MDLYLYPLSLFEGGAPMDKAKCFEVDPLSIPGIQDTIISLHQKLMAPYHSFSSPAEQRVCALELLHNAICALSPVLLKNGD